MAGTSTELIKQKLDIVEFLKNYLELRPAGRNFKALCPFHREKSPSFMVSPDRQSWHCFGCSLGGDIFTFLMRYENLEFSEALKILAERTGVELQRVNPAEYKLAGLLYDANEAAKNFFIEELPKASVTRDYLKTRGLQKETLATFEIGWAPNDPESLTLFLLNKGYSPDDVMRAGLAFKTERGLMLDRFRGRVMFPIHNHIGKVVGFTSRILPQLDTGTMGKYVNSPETPIFNKSRLLYGFWKTKEAIRESGAAFVVEGQMDMLMSWQAGVKNAVASSGTAFTTDHLRTLRRLADTLLMSFDNDEAGWAAGERAIDLAEANDFSVKVVRIEGFKDAADAVLADPKNLTNAIERAEPAMRVYFEHYLPTQTGLPQQAGFPTKADFKDRKNLQNLRTVLGKIRAVSSAVLRDEWLKELSKRVGLGLRVLEEEMARIAASPALQAIKEEPNPGTAEIKPASRWELVTQRVLSAAMMHAKLTEVPRENLVPKYGVIFDMLQTGEKGSANAELDALMNLIMLRSEELTAEEFELLKTELLKEYLKQKREELAAEVRRAESSGDEAALRDALEVLRKLSR